MAIVNWLAHHMLTCPFKHATGFDCPGCGIQRSFIAMLKGDFRESFHLYPALFLVLCTLTIVAIHIVFKLKHGAAYVKYGYIITTIVILISYGFKMAHSWH
jgi:hypothetical protein